MKKNIEDFESFRNTKDRDKLRSKGPIYRVFGRRRASSEPTRENIMREALAAIVSVVRARVPNASDRDDLCGDAVLTTLIKVEIDHLDVSTAAAIRPFARKVARDAVINYFRRADVHASLLGHDELCEFAANDGGGFGLIDSNEALTALRACIKELDEPDQLILKKAMSGKTRRAIAAEYGLHPDTIRARLRRVRAHLMALYLRRVGDSSNTPD